MCGIVSFFGQHDGVVRVVEALHLLEYRAPDSTGAAVVDEDGCLSVRRSVGTPANLIRRMAGAPLFLPAAAEDQQVRRLLEEEQLPYKLDSLRDLSGFRVEALYRTPGLSVGLGDRGRPGAPPQAECQARFSERLCATVGAAGSPASPDYDPDPVRHTFRLLAAHVAGRVDQDPGLRQALDEALQARVTGSAFPDWMAAWKLEVAANTPGLAFAVAVRRFQETFPGLADHLAPEEWERVGGLTARAMAQVVLGHGRWATVGPATEANAHPFTDRGGVRVVCENGSHNARVLLGLRDQQWAWWRARGLTGAEPVHRSDNTTEVIALEWERVAIQIEEGTLPEEDASFMRRLEDQGITDPEEQALRLTLRKLREGNAHACAFFSRRRPGQLIVSSHDKPIAIAMRRVDGPDGQERSELMVASDVNAALMLWPGPEVDRVADQLAGLEEAVRKGEIKVEDAEAERQELLDRFTIEVVFLDADVNLGLELLASIQNRVVGGRVVPQVQVTRYDGAPLDVPTRAIRLNPNMVGKRGFPTFIESHLDEVPDVLDELVRAYAREGLVRLEGVWAQGESVQPGLNLAELRERFGPGLAGLERLLLVGEGSSWRVAQAAAPLLRTLLPGVLVSVYRPVELLNMGPALAPKADLAVEISWSGTTDSLLKVDRWLEELGVLRLAVTGRPWSDLGRRAGRSAGTLDVHTGVEVSVATVKGYQGLLMVCLLLAVQIAGLRSEPQAPSQIQAMVEELAVAVPAQVRAVAGDADRRAKVREAAQRCARFNKVVVLGDSPIDIEAELKIEELAQIVAAAFDFQAASVRPLMERSARMQADEQRVLFVINATTPQACREAQPIVQVLQELGVDFLAHTTDADLAGTWDALPHATAFLSPQVSEALQPLVDAMFFYDLAIGLAYARGLPPESIDRPRNLAKSITITGAERRAEVESRHELSSPALEEFGFPGREPPPGMPDPRAFPAAAVLQSGLAAIESDPPAWLELGRMRHLVVAADAEATENGAAMAAAVWGDLLGIDLAVYRRHLSEWPELVAETTLIRLVRSGERLAFRKEHTLALPEDVSPLGHELLSAAFLSGLAVRAARARGIQAGAWEAGLLRMPVLLANLLADGDLSDALEKALGPYVQAGYDKLHVIGGGQDHLAARSIARSLRERGFLAEAQYTDSAWHGPLAAVGGPGADRDTLVVILANDPLFQAAALVDTQVYRTRHAPVLLAVPAGDQDLPVVQGVGAQTVLPVPAVPRPFVPLVAAALGEVLAGTMDRLWNQPRLSE